MPELMLNSYVTLDLGSAEKISALLHTAGAGISGDAANMVCRIRRVSNGDWWKGTTSTWEAAVFNNAMVETHAVSLPGVYEFDFSATGNSAVDEYHVYIVNGGGGGNPAVGYSFMKSRRNTLNSLLADYPVAGSPTTMGQAIHNVHQVSTGDVEIDDELNQQIFYDGEGGGGVAFLTFDLKNAQGLATAREVFKRERA